MKDIKQSIKEGRALHLEFLRTKKEAEVSEAKRREVNQSFINLLVRR